MVLGAWAMNRYKWDAVWSVVVYACVTLVVFVASMVWDRHATSDDGLEGFVYVAPTLMAFVGVLTLVASAVTLVLPSLGAAKAGQLVSAVPHVLPFLLYGYLAVMSVGTGSFAVEDGSLALTLAYIFGTLAHAGWAGFAVREALRTDEPAQFAGA